MSGTTIERRVDVWELRCRFNQSRYWDLVRAGMITAHLDRSNPSRNGPPGTQQQQWYYRDPATGDDLARVTQFVRPDGSLAAGRKPDPKLLVVGGVEYHLFPGGAAKHDPSLQYPEGWIRSTYMLWRRVKCWVLGR